MLYGQSPAPSALLRAAGELSLLDRGSLLRDIPPATLMSMRRLRAFRVLNLIAPHWKRSWQYVSALRIRWVAYILKTISSQLKSLAKAMHLSCMVSSSSSYMCQIEIIPKEIGSAAEDLFSVRLTLSEVLIGFDVSNLSGCLIRSFSHVISYKLSHRSRC